MPSYHVQGDANGNRVGSALLAQCLGGNNMKEGKTKSPSNSQDLKSPIRGQRRGKERRSSGQTRQPDALTSEYWLEKLHFGCADM